jgi:nucleotide-binding universal stress UspA family protein
MAARGVIIFPTDFSELSLAALPWAHRMAEQLEARIHCVYVVEEPYIYATLDMATVPVPTTGELTAAAEKRMAAFVEEHRQVLGDVTTRILVGRPAAEIVQYANQQQASLIVVATHGYGGLKHALLGSTTEAVLRHAACPVLAVRSA